MDELTVEQVHAMPASRERVFAALTEPDELAKWWGPEGFTIPALEVDLRVGGGYRIEMQPPEGEPFHLSGRYSEVDVPARLSYTFCWEPPAADDRETLATLTLTERDGSTEVALRQATFATEERRALHDEGWAQSFAKLERHLSGSSAD